jgi:ketosteroid isomerase-like protein
MKIRLLFALVGLAISFALPTFAQQKETVDPQTNQKILAIGKAYDEGENANDAAAIAALFTEDAVFVTDRGPVNGRQAIEKLYTDLYKGWHPKNHITKFDGNAPHLIATAGNELWATGEWSETGQGETDGPIPVKGYWAAIYIREGDDWKLRMLAYNITPAPAATPSPTTQGMTRERERQLAIDRAGGSDAFKAAELLASTMQRVRMGQ